MQLGYVTRCKEERCKRKGQVFKYQIISQPKLHKFVIECTSVRHIGLHVLGYSKCSK